MNESQYSRIEHGKVVGEAMLFMLSRPKNADGTIGYLAKRGSPEWLDWQAYFEANGMRRKASLMRLHEQFMVPCSDPREFDETYRGLMPVPAAMVTELSLEDRNRLAGRLKGMFQPTPKWKGGAPGASPLSKRPMSSQEMESFARLTGQPTPDVEQKAAE